jgi:hypothetical protein
MFKTIKIAFGVTAISMMAINVASADMACHNESGQRSTAGDVSTSITFKVYGENDETQFKIYWLDYDGNRVFYKHVFAGDTYKQQTYLTHPWVVTAPIPGGGEDCIDVYFPKQGGSTITLD